MNINVNLPTLQRSLSDVVAEYDLKAAALADAYKTFQQAGTDLKTAATIGGTWGNVTIDTGDRLYESSLATSLLKSAWMHIHDGLNINRLASPNDKRLFQQAMSNPPPFTLDNIRATFGKYILDPRGNILRGLAEVFCGLDDSYKSHDTVKIGVDGLPKRIIMSGFSGYSSYGKDKIETVLNALAAYQGKPLVTWREISALLDGREDVLEKAGDLPVNKTWDKPETTPGRGIRLRTFQNGNGHLFFDKPTLRDINMALAEFYGEVLPDTPDENPKRKQSTALSKDLQYYPTPKAVVDRVIDHIYQVKGKRYLEPSCGCGRFMDALRAKGAQVFGVEVDAGRVAECRAKGHGVHHGNFLEFLFRPSELFDGVIMNPPFYGKHYVKHVEHALHFIKPGGTLTAILPVTARYDHKLLKGSWDDLPVGSFSESGTNINTTILTIRVPE